MFLSAYVVKKYEAGTQKHRSYIECLNLSSAIGFLHSTLQSALHL
jgi:hypothetical protein